MDLAPGTLLCAEKFEIVRRIGVGGSSAVFEALQTRLNKKVALKLLPISAEADLLARRETLSASIRSPHIIEIFDLEVDSAHDLLVIAMELLDGASLSTILLSRSTLPEVECVTVLREALKGVASAHERGIVHGDLKPSNVFCVSAAAAERVVLLDFGIASLSFAGSEALSRTVGGTPLWMNPEALSGRDRTWRADTWALGLLAYTMLAGEHYFSTAAPLLSAILLPNKERPSELLRQRGIQAPAWLDKLFGATVNVDESQLLAARALLKLLPEVKSTVPRLDEAPSSKMRASAHDAYAATQVDARMYGDAYPVPQYGPAASIQHRVARILPDALRPSAPEIAAFIDSLFDDASPEKGILRLSGPRIDFAKGYDFFLAALASRRENGIQTMTFLAYTTSIEDVLAQLDALTLKVIIVVIDTPDLGAGVRSKIATIFRKFRAALIPVYVRDISTLRAGEAKDWLRKRWQINRPVTNPFEPRVFDRTLLHGHVEVINALIQEIGAGGAAALGVYGAPGAGKTSVVRHAQNECVNQAEFCWLNFGTVLHTSPNEILEKAAELFGVPFAVVDGRPLDALTAGVTAALNSAERNGLRLVLVLDDADVIVDPERLAANAADAAVFIQLRQQLANLLSGGGLTVVIVGLRTFMLEREVIGTLVNPLRKYFRRVRVPPLRIVEISELCKLGRQVDLHFDEPAIDRVQHWARGNIQAAQMICGRVLEQTGDTEQFSPIGVDAVDAAAATLVNSWESFDRRLVPYLTRTERDVLATIPRASVKNALDLVPLLPEASDAEVGSALDYLVAMGVVERSNRRVTVAGKLLEGWVKANLKPPAGPERRGRERKLRAAVFGIVGSALLYGGYTMWLSSGQQTVTVSHEHCQTVMFAPRRVASETKASSVRTASLQVMLSRKCDADQGGNVDLKPLRSTNASFKPGGAEFKADVEASERYWNKTIEVTDLVATDGQSYELELTGDGNAQQLTIKRNVLGELPSALRALIAAAGAIPAILGLLSGFYGDVRKWVLSLTAPKPE